MTIEALKPFLGVRADDSRLLALLAEWGVQRRPEATEFLKSPYEVSFHISKLGIMLYFQDEAYVLNRNPSQWGKSSLVLRSVVACSGIENQVRPYCGFMPYGIEWTDTRAQVRQKLQTHQAGELHVGWRDCWWQGDRYFIVNYQPGEFGESEQPGVFEFIQGLFLPASPIASHTKAYPSASTLLSLLGSSTRSADFLNAFADFEVDTWEQDTHINLQRQYGIELYFDPEKPANDGTPSFAGVNLTRDRLGPSVAWLGELPLGLNFDKSIDDVKQIVGRKPDQADYDLGVWGWAKWFLPDYLLWVNFDTMRNRLESVAIIARGYNEDDSL